MSATSPETTGKIPFTFQGETYSTWYKVVGDLKSGGRPLVTLHGGPGFSHHYMLPHAQFVSRLNIPVVFYDQIGIGESSHPEKGKGEEKKSFWTMEVFMDELDNLLKYLGIEGDFDLLGHSWGAFLAVHYASNRVPKGLKRLILADGTCSMQLWTKGTDALRLRLPEDVQKVLKEHEEKGTTDSKEYHDAMEVWFAKHICTANPLPELLAKSFGAMGEDPTVYSAMIGASEVCCTGTLKTWSCIDQLHNISAPTLLLNAPESEAQDVNQWPMFHKIPRVKWVQFAKSTHLAQFEEPERYLEVVGEFLEA
ncbi:Alpha/Beta hydrolase protein [Rhodofomes roseus]|uniref:Alpha/Beta hydrolase protein n=1 Tax=Rhodofomes roseus TaxID=34475 RepID=A0ABQ8KAR3_9APHY|nr:Alpha/Beta hydrolase protein [Rhodofomes roseus]KAH9834560.1 Alpha/Beta hydrolase protein [Rhodofomes roseus]